ncbi:MAG: hypothetical protein K2F81_04595 [Ruminococcus sp.]|nr:hypothetical protein [Ruminococcus sp.]
MNDNLIEDYRTVITNHLLTSNLIVDVVGDGKYSNKENTDLIPSEQLLWEKIFPAQYIPYTVQETGTYLFYDIEESVSQINSYLSVNIIFWVITHKDSIKYNNKLKLDVLSREIKNIMNKNCNLGISKNNFVSNTLLNDQLLSEYTGRALVFNVTDFNDKLRYSKSDGR